MKRNEKLRALRMATGLSQIRFSETIDVNQSTYMEYESGRYELPPYVLENLRRVYGVSPEVFADESNDIFLPPGGVKKAPKKTRNEPTAGPRRSYVSESPWPELPERCRSCLWRIQHGEKTVGCGYAAHRGHTVRGCPIGEQCTRYRRDMSIGKGKRRYL